MKIFEISTNVLITKILFTIMIFNFVNCGCTNKTVIKQTETGGNYDGPRRGMLTPEEHKIARIAWKYFENNYQPKTGLVNSTHMYPSVTMWDIASYMGGMVSAFELGIINKTEFDKRLVTLLKTFNKLSFYRDELPNKAYNTKTAEKVNYINKPGEIGFSAIDLGRLLIWLKIIKERYPQYAGSIDKFILRWKFCNVIDKRGTMFGAAVGKNKKTIYLQEGRLGYEEYAAKGFQLWGFDLTKALKPEPMDFISLYNIDLPYDSRDPRKLGAHNYVVSESYVLDAIEFGWDYANDNYSKDNVYTDLVLVDFAQRVYNVQKERYKATGILTARTEHQLDGKPYFVYDTIFSDGYPWNTITDKGDYVPQFAAVALKAAFGLWVVWNTPYTDILFDYVSNLYDPQKGFYEGIYENGKGVINTFTANNNGIILTCLLYKEKGKLLQFSGKESLWEKTIYNDFYNNKCVKERLEIIDKSK